MLRVADSHRFACASDALRTVLRSGLGLCDPSGGLRQGWCLALLVVVAGCNGSRGHVYRVPSSSMEPTLHCARPAPGCLGEGRDLVYAVPYRDGDAPRRGDIVVFQAPAAAALRCSAGGLFIKRVIGLHTGALAGAGRHDPDRRQGPPRAMAAAGTAGRPELSRRPDSARPLPAGRRQPRVLLRLPRLRSRFTRRPPRPDRRDQARIRADPSSLAFRGCLGAALL